MFSTESQFKSKSLKQNDKKENKKEVHNLIYPMGKD